jgi:adenosylmethionine-8-amino-7-oxononanoate aminotransferase
MTTATRPERYTGEQIEDLQQIAADHLFMHGSQTNDWKGDLKIFVKGENCWVTDIWGNRLLDAMAGLWYKAAGYGRKEIADAAYAQMLAIESPPAPGACVPTVQLAGKIAELYSDHNCRTFFVSGGSEAVETAVKMAKKHQQLKGKGGAFKVISRRGSYHGATAMAVSLGKPAYADPVGPDMPGAMWVVNWNSYRMPYEGNPKDVAVKCANEFEAVIQHQGPDSVAAIIAEPVSAAAGIQVPPAEYWQRLREIADKYDILLIADEVITGFGRLGTYFGPENWGVQPDITTVAKALTSGYSPLGAVIATKKVADTFLGGDRETFKHLITFGGHPVSAAAGLANLKVFEREDLVGNSRRMGTYLFERLQELKKHKIVGDVRGGLGLLAAVELVQDRATKKPFPREAGLGKKLPKMLYDRKLVSFRAADLITLCPPLSINKGEIDFLVGVLDETIGNLQSELGVR